jgi:molybdate transport system permease protein
VVQPLQGAFEAVGRGPLEAAATLGAGRLDAFFTVASPLALRGYVTATVLGFAHTLGEFGVVLMVGGNIPGRTRVISIAIYEQVETLNYDQAHVLAAGLLVFSFVVLVLVYALNRRFPVHAA